MNSRLGLAILGALAALLTAGTGAQAAVSVAQGVAPLTVIGTPGPARLSNADEKRFDALMLEHRTTRGRLPADQRRDLDRLTARVRDALFPTGGEGPGSGTWENARKAVAVILPGLTANETSTLAGYALDGIVAGDIEVLRFARTDPGFTLLSAFKLDYMRLQQQMKNASRGYTILSALLKTKDRKSTRLNSSHT